MRSFFLWRRGALMGPDRRSGRADGFFRWLRQRGHPGPVPLLEPAAWALAASYAVSAVLHAGRVPDGAPGIAVASALSSFLLAGTAAVAHRSQEGEIRSALTAGVGALVVANAVFRMGVGPGPEQVTHLGLVLVGLGAFLDGGVFLPLAGLAGVSWLLTVPRYGGLDVTAHFGGYLLGSMVLGCVLLVARGYRGESRDGTGEAEDGLSEDLRVSLGWYKKLFLESPALMCVHDGNGRIEEVNPAGLEALNYARQDVVGRNIMEFMVPVTEDGPEQYLRDIQRLGWTEGLLRARRADGRLRVWEYRSTILENGPERLVLATATDVSDLAETPDWVPSGTGVRQR